MPDQDREIPGLGVFTASKHGKWISVEGCIEFRGAFPDMMFSFRPTRAAKDVVTKQLLDRFQWFEFQLDSALQALPAKLGPVIKLYTAANQKVTDSEILGNLVWESISIPNTGIIECYAKIPRVVEHLDIVLRFNKSIWSNKMRLRTVHFDG